MFVSYYGRLPTRVILSEPKAITLSAVINFVIIKHSTAENNSLTFFLTFSQLKSKIKIKIKKICSLCKMQPAFEKEKKNGLERLVLYQHSMEMLTRIANETFPFLKECFELDIQSLDFFNKEYSWPFCCCDRN